MKKKNPIIAQAKKEGYEIGFKLGFEQGIEVRQQAAEILFAKKINELENVKGIGPKTFGLFSKHFKDYSKE